VVRFGATSKSEYPVPDWLEKTLELVDVQRSSASEPFLLGNQNGVALVSQNEEGLSIRAAKWNELTPADNGMNLSRGRAKLLHKINAKQVLSFFALIGLGTLIYLRSPSNDQLIAEVQSLKGFLSDIDANNKLSAQVAKVSNETYALDKNTAIRMGELQQVQQETNKMVGDLKRDQQERNKSIGDLTTPVREVRQDYKELTSRLEGISAASKETLVKMDLIEKSTRKLRVPGRDNPP
jgi:methyl-accepting chemotaxis protein